MVCVVTTSGYLSSISVYKVLLVFSTGCWESCITLASVVEGLTNDSGM